MKSALKFLCGVLLGACLVMLYLHRKLIEAFFKGEELPKAPESCPYSKAE